DGSTAANFDTKMGAMPAYSTVHILAGTYQTAGSGVWVLKSGQVILGSGIDNPILHITTNGFSIASPYNAASTNITVADFTVDLTGNTNQSGGVALYGSHHTIRRVKCLNQSGGYALYISAVT